MKSDNTKKLDKRTGIKKAHNHHLQIVLAGQPNCGKSTLFNEVAGYKSVASNFPGATVEYTHSHVNVAGVTCDVIDLPGFYSLTSLDPAALESQRYLLTRNVDVLINVVDASLLGRSLELTLQLMDLEIPMVLCLNMIDEAERKGIEINLKSLSDFLGIPVIATVASHGRGIRSLFVAAFEAARTHKKGNHIYGNRDVEGVIEELSKILKHHLKNESHFPVHLLATKLLERDRYFEDIILKIHPDLIRKIDSCRNKLEKSHGKSSDKVIDSERHALSMSIFEKVSEVKRPVQHWRDRIDDVLMHNLFGYLFLFLFLYLFFIVIFKTGAWLETPLVDFFGKTTASITNRFGTSTLFSVVATGVVQGIGGGIAIVLPYLFPFLFGLAILEDVGYLPRIAFLMDVFMHKIGLHGKAIIPAILGYGCNVPAVMATRILESQRDRFIASLIASMVPCAARMTIIFGLVGYYLGGTAAMAIYLLNLLVIGLSGALLSKLLPEVTPGMILEMPAYQAPRLKIALMKTWFRLKDFVIIAWPLLIAGSIALGLAEYFHLTDLFNRVLSPVTSLLGLPVKTGTTLIFGILRKELSMLMLFQALDTGDILTVMSYGQMLVFTIFVVFYIPCVATMGALYKQIRMKRTLFIFAWTFMIALVLGLVTRIITTIIW